MVKTGYVAQDWDISNLKGHQNCIIGSKVTAILLKGWILPFGGVASKKGLRLQPAQQACLIELKTWQRGRLTYLHVVTSLSTELLSPRVHKTTSIGSPWQ